jgi:hypothetical protein
MGVNKKIIETEATPPQTAGFNAVLYTGTGSAQSITGVGFQPDMVWIKDRTQAYTHNITDTTRGTSKQLFPPYTNGEDTTYTNRVTSFDADGFTIGNDNYVNTNGNNFVAYCWTANGGTTSSNTDGTITSTVQANTAGGFSIVTYTGTGSNGTIGHGLDSAPDFIVTKARTTISPAIAEAWPAFHSSLTSNNILYLDKTYTASSGNKTSVYSDPTTTSTTFGIGNWRGINQSGTDYIAYCFHSVSGYSAFGSYAGNGTSQSINIGFQPDLLILRKYDDNQDWMMWDSVRDGNPKQARLEANSDAAEVSGTTNINFTSTGFEFTSSYYNDSGKNSIYMAFKVT